MPNNLASRPPSVIIAGVNKAGTTSLFAALSAHPDVATSDVKETCFFLPLRYREPMPPIERYYEHFARAGDAQVIMEATPGYFYGGEHIAPAIDDAAPDVRIIVVLREPVSRLLSFFRFQQSMLTLPDDLGADDYVTRCLVADPDDLARRRSLNPYFGIEGGHYSRYLSPWIDTFGDRLSILFFDELAADMDGVTRRLGSQFGLDPTGWTGLSTRENRTIAPRRRGLHRMALGLNRVLEPQLRRHPALKRCARAIYGRVNTDEARAELSEGCRRELEQHFAPWNHRLHDALVARDPATTLPDWVH